MRTLRYLIFFSFFVSSCTVDNEDISKETSKDSSRNVIEPFTEQSGSSDSSALKEVDYGIKFTEISYGLGELEGVKPFNDNESPSGRSQLSNVFHVLVNSDTIEGKLGASFGVVFEINGYDERFVEIEVVWTFPKTITDSQGNEFASFRESKPADVNKEDFTYYILETEHEIVKGEWKMQILHKNAEIYSRSFYVI